ncbi:MAG: hypothetical protein KGD64_08260 [Candidatus Heimdallarchaeota archaeon]|nr:hypothetical protein [Candidatus Heimdallarchaeota archaeon]
MIIYANGRLKATDVLGNTRDIGVVGTEQDEVKVSDHEQENILRGILKELKKMTFHFSIINDMSIENKDLEI